MTKKQIYALCLKICYQNQRNPVTPRCAEENFLYRRRQGIGINYYFHKLVSSLILIVSLEHLGVHEYSPATRHICRRKPVPPKCQIRSSADQTETHLK